MKLKKQTVFAVTLVFLLLLAVFALTYSESVKMAVSDAVNDDRAMLSQVNIKMIDRMLGTEDQSSWGKIIGERGDLMITVLDSRGRIVVSSADRSRGVLDVRVQNSFFYKGREYSIRSSKYFFDDDDNPKQNLTEFIFAEFVTVSVLVVISCLIIYHFTLAPFRRFYSLFEEYEKTGTLQENHFSGYVGKVYNRFVQLTQTLDREQEKQRRIIASVSHDIKTPLTSIMGYTERLKKDNISPERRERYLNTVYDKSVQIRGLVDEFDEYLSYNQKIPVKLERISTEELCDLFRREYAVDIEAAGVRFEVINKAPEVYILVDMQKLNRVFGNIIGNSLKHFSDSEKQIRVTVISGVKIVTVKISDSGEGVPESQLDMIFEPFYTSDKARKVAGLGLAICREAVESIGGSIYAQQSEFGGLEVCIEIMKEKSK